MSHEPHDVPPAASKPVLAIEAAATAKASTATVKPAAATAKVSAATAKVADATAKVADATAKVAAATAKVAAAAAKVADATANYAAVTAAAASTEATAPVPVSDDKSLFVVFVLTVCTCPAERYHHGRGVQSDHGPGDQTSFPRWRAPTYF
jgi:hypothetical protein